MTTADRAWVVAVTGGIAAGKTAVTRRFQTLGVPVHDADQAARAVVAAGSAGLAEIVERFGSGVLDAAGELDRPAMRARIFDKPAARIELEAIIHPRIRRWLQDKVRQQHQPYAMLAIPLLTEHQAAYDWLQRVLVIDIDPALQLQRLLQRDGIGIELAERIIASQSSAAARLAIADDVIRNNGSESALDDQVAALHQQYLRLARDYVIDG
ncbi:dephospho-CoA kinase [Frateuria aurantia]|uniref:Dephospho-CoA kinase n=1 Tax=Frateuria aurantia (strain ATCC 33424 / DSM 6220 / KCTC 2777 / LMG 1558 / NBRC 3245 / NCIMB 13370) TaxID=767434 RepID=H8L4F6_FRAAD|nr:dephospho-CoA kinase [Frateuria aurantia]AFC85630.1 dephospho-CoA kinase [Frateuria aurantia DSM 6220]